jgi:hypothetical protein
MIPKKSSPSSHPPPPPPPPPSTHRHRDARGVQRRELALDKSPIQPGRLCYAHTPSSPTIPFINSIRFNQSFSLSRSPSTSFSRLPHNPSPFPFPFPSPSHPSPSASSSSSSTTQLTLLTHADMISLHQPSLSAASALQSRAYPLPAHALVRCRVLVASSSSLSESRC